MTVFFIFFFNRHILTELGQNLSYFGKHYTTPHQKENKNKYLLEGLYHWFRIDLVNKSKLCPKVIFKHCFVN